MQKENKNVVVITVPLVRKAVVGQALPDNAPTPKGIFPPHVILNSFQDLHRLFSKQAFTLIELLIVVLIIGILAAVAVPQYQKAMEKSKASQALSIIRSISAAQEAYYLANGTYAYQFSKLDVVMPGWPANSNTQSYSSGEALSNGDWSVQLYSEARGQGVIVVRLKGPYAGSLFLYLFKYYYPNLQTAPLHTILCGGTNKEYYCQKIMGFKNYKDNLYY